MEMTDYSELPEPLVDASVDCRGLPFMPLETTKLRESGLVAISDGDEFKAAVLLWAKSWSEIPAGSLPDDDRILSKAAGYSGSHFSRLKKVALHGWILCSDGRFYHPLICDLAEIAANRRKKRSEAANSRWSAERAKSVGKSAKAPKAGNARPDASANASAMVGTVKGTDKGKEESRAREKIEGADAKTVQTWDSLFLDKDSLRIIFEAEELGQKCADPAGRKRECWFMAKGVLMVLDQATAEQAGKVIGQIQRQYSLDEEELAAIALAAWQFKPNNGRSYFASQAQKVAVRR